MLILKNSYSGKQNPLKLLKKLNHEVESLCFCLKLFHNKLKNTYKITYIITYKITLENNYTLINKLSDNILFNFCLTVCFTCIYKFYKFYNVILYDNI